MCARARQQVHAADRLIEYPIVAGLGFGSCLWLSGTSFHPAAADARPDRTGAALTVLSDAAEASLRQLAYGSQMLSSAASVMQPLLFELCGVRKCK
jgi:hypothetical protein